MAKILIVAPFVPSAISLQAGHRLLREYLLKKAKTDEVSLLIVSNSKEYALAEQLKIPSVTLVGIFKVGSFARVIALALGFFKFAPRFNTRYSPRVSSFIKNEYAKNKYDYVRFEFSQVFRYADDLKRFYPHACVELSVIDLQVQVVLRKRFFESVIFSKYTYDSECRLLRLANNAVVLCQKDADLIKGLYGQGINCSVCFPSLPSWIGRVNREPDSLLPNTILFWGALDRVENEDAVLWFLDNVYDDLARIYPNLKIFIVGSNPTAKILKRSNQNIVVTGFVDDPSPYFESAAVGVVPLRSGAGIKLKTLEMLAAGIPVISTEIGVEGIDLAGKSVSIANDARQFANAVSRVLDGSVVAHVSDL